ncbi:ubiquitin-associated and SH3 domain-containing protein B-like [Mytilus galloprovincialis]|uniref:ubiquitin-associated and SH3 domain-containing protein B-like n=1 Tax=Mytilus galloprovincialis TaxID=29158 RepID=UPI003F7C5674
MASADLPTRHHRNDTIKRRQTPSALDILMQMGFPKQRAEKAIAATGDNGVQLASDWLLSHVHDPTLDSNIPREYILYLCPVGPLQKQLTEFWEKSQNMCGFNGAHSYFPHVTLCPFFKCDDNKVHVLSEAMAKMEEKLSQCPGKLQLDFFSQVNFIGLFIRDQHYDFLMKIADDFSAEIRKSGVNLEPHRKQLHMTLAYQYPTEQHEALLKLAKEIDLSADVRWDYRLYSRDARSGPTEVRKVIKCYTHQLGDELELIEGDFISVDLAEVEKSKDRWYHGTSWLTGNAGMFPGTYTKKTQETFAWTKQRSYPLVERPSSVNPVTNGFHSEVAHDENQYALVVKNRPHDSPKFTRSHPPKKTRAESPPPKLPPTKINRADSNPTKITRAESPPPKLPPTKINRADSNPTKVTRAESPPPKLPPKKQGPCKLFIMRHGERPDFSLGRSWFEEAFDDDGVYTRKNLNLPEKMYKRKTYLEYNYDPPLTEVGKFQAKIAGEYLLKTNCSISHIYTSPSLRCVQTSVEVYKVLGLTNKIKIEPGLFEWTYHVGVPKFMDPQELTDVGLPILTNHCPQFVREDLDPDETVDELYHRCNRATREILKSHEKSGDSVLLVGHSGTLDLCSRSLLGKQSKTEPQYQDFITKIPFCCAISIQQSPDKKKWTVCSDHHLPLSMGKCTGLKIDTLKRVME